MRKMDQKHTLGNLIGKMFYTNASGAETLLFTMYYQNEHYLLESLNKQAENRHFGSN